MMTLEDVARVAQIVFAAATTTIAVMAYRWHRQNARIEASRRLSEDLRNYNQMVLQDDELLDHEIEHHPYGELDRDGVKRMFRYFIRLNITVSLWEAKKRNAVSNDRFELHVKNTARLLFRERAFIRQHVLQRGYTDDFRRLLDSEWQAIERDLGP